MFENLGEANQAEINAREEENTNEMKSLINKTLKSILTMLFKDFKTFQRLSKSSFASVQI